VVAVAPFLFVGLADLMRDDGSLLDAVAAAYPPRRVSWREGGAYPLLLTVSRTDFGHAIHVHAARPRPDGRGLVTFTVDLATVDGVQDRAAAKALRRIDDALVSLAAAVRPMLLVSRVEFAVDELFDAAPEDAAIFASGWACPQRMDERRAAGFRRVLAGTAHEEIGGGIRWSGASPETAERLRAVWVRDGRARDARRRSGR
jgi:hypothetical protein